MKLIKSSLSFFPWFKLGSISSIRQYVSTSQQNMSQLRAGKTLTRLTPTLLTPGLAQKIENTKDRKYKI